MKKAFSIILGVLVLDQALKIWVKTNMKLGQEYVIFDWFIIHFTENVGMAFGMQLGGEYGKLILSVFRIVVVTGVGYYLYSMIKRNASPIVVVALSLVIAGALGNIIDSTFYGLLFSDSYGHVAHFLPKEGGYAGILYGRVVDMFYFPLFDGFFPSWFPFVGGKHFSFFSAIFNIADAAITIGMGLIILFQKRFLTK
jgi:signal peptidase II